MPRVRHLLSLVLNGGADSQKSYIERSTRLLESCMRVSASLSPGVEKARFQVTEIVHHNDLILLGELFINE